MTPIQGLQRIAQERSWASVQDFWKTHKTFIAWCALVLGIFVSQAQLYYVATEAQTNVTKIEEERSARLKAQTSINFFFCNSNNEQDAVLGKLLAISIRGAPPHKKLNHDQLKSLRVFEETEEDLSSPADCEQISTKLQDASGGSEP